MCCLVFREKAGKPLCAVEFKRARGTGQLCPGLGVRCKPWQMALTLLCLFTLPQVLPSEVRESRRENPPRTGARTGARSGLPSEGGIYMAGCSCT